MAPMQSGHVPFGLKRRAAGNNDYESSPEAIIVPVVILLRGFPDIFVFQSIILNLFLDVVLLTGAAIASVYTYWQRRKNNDQIFDKASHSKSSRKVVPNWLSSWLDTPRLRSSRASDESSRTHKLDLAKSGSGNVTSENPDSDTIALRPISVYLPTYPLTAYETYDRYPSIAGPGDQALRPKVIGAPLR
ncbi:hypothetical protein ACEPAI_8972 [Sanghuangporus weigelae]